jgi:hypothetical protein
VTALIATAAIVVAAVVAELVLPGSPIYHAGWYNVTIAAAIVINASLVRKYSRTTRAPRRVGAIALVFGAAVCGLAGIASGLFGPDNQMIVGAPGQRVAVAGLGIIVFPIGAEATTAPTVSVERPMQGPMEVAERARDAGGFIVRTVPRDVAYVEARDLHGNHLTITQPMGAVFLSPVLLMRQHQTIAGLDLPFDSFNVPAARRVVKALLFTPAQAAMVLHRTEGVAAVLFAVDDENDRPLRNAIALSDSGRTVHAGGLLLRATVGPYPAVQVVSAPNLMATILGTLLMVAGVVALVL